MSRKLGRAIVAVAGMVLGRRNIVRISRFLLDAARLDVINDMAANGEALVQRTVCAHTTNGTLVVFDVGANVGDWSHSFLQASHRARRSDLHLHAFEACAGTFRRLQENFADDDNLTSVDISHVALSDRVGTAEFHVTDVGAGTNALDWPTNLSSKSETVAVTTIDAYCQERGIAYIDLLKIDTEGHDVSVIRGAEQLLTRHRIELVQFEYNHRWIYSRSFLRDAFLWFERFGYRVGKITPKGIEFYPSWNHELETFKEGNYLACRPVWIDRFPVIDWWYCGKHT